MHKITTSKSVKLYQNRGKNRCILELKLTLV